MTSLRHLVAWVAAGTLLMAAGPRAQSADEAAITLFQRAADAYAFQHRQVQRRAGENADQATMAQAIRMARVIPAEGTLFSPTAGAAVRARIVTALRASGCRQPVSANSVVPRPTEDASSGEPVAGCVARMLPRLPAELEYRAAGVVLLIVDTHANLVVDVLHGAFP